MLESEDQVYVRHTANTVDDLLLKQIGARVCPIGTVIFPKVGGAVATNKKRILAIETAFDNNVLGVVPKLGLLPGWLYFFLSAADLMQMARTTALPSIRKSTVAKLAIPLPPMEEQQRLVARIDKVRQSARELHRKQEETQAEFDALSQAILAKAFRGEL